MKNNRFNKFKTVNYKRFKIYIFTVSILATAVCIFLILNHYKIITIFNSEPSRNYNNNYSSNSIDETDKIIEQDGLSAGINYLNKKIIESNDPSEKAQFYLKKSTILTSNNASPASVKSAIEAARMAEEIDKTTDSALIIASLEESNGNIAEAIKYYKIYTDRIPDSEKNNEDSEYAFEYYSKYTDDLEVMQSENK